MTTLTGACRKPLASVVTVVGLIAIVLAIAAGGWVAAAGDPAAASVARMEAGGL